MSGGPRPPVPGLIPLAALSRRPPRPRRRPETIDASTESRGLEPRAAAPGRRRHRRRASATAAVDKQSRSSSPALDRPPRVNPIFVWVRQEDTRIVDVKCEDYDKRNRILLTKTAHGWRAIPRTEMLGAPRASAKQTSSTVPSPTTHHGHHHRHHHKRRSKKSKNQQSTSVQFPDPESSSEPSWVTSENVNIESLLPSHTIHVKRTESLDDLSKSVNSAPEQDIARTIPECSTPDKICDVSPLENLLAVAELELKQHMQSGKWESEPQEHSEDINDTDKSVNPSIEEIDELLKTKAHELQIDITDDDNKSPECSYNDDDEMSMNDILSRLEQSLQSPQGFGSDNSFDDEISEQDTKSEKVFSNLEDSKTVPDNYVTLSKISTAFEVSAKEEFTENLTINFSKMDHCAQGEIIDENIEANTFLDKIESFNPKENFCLHVPTLETKCVQSVDQRKYKSEDDEKIINDFQEAIPTNSNINNNYVDPLNNKDDFTIPGEQGDEAKNKCSNEDQIYQEDLPHHKNVNKIESSTYSLQLEKEYGIAKSSTESDSKVVEAESSTSLEEPIIPSENKTEKNSEVCLDLSIKKNLDLTVNAVGKVPKSIEENSEGPTDLSIRKTALSPITNLRSPVHEGSETSQSPQPSGIPAVPPSPDIVSTSTAPFSKPRSAFLESLLANSINKLPFNNNETNEKQKEPLDLGKNRKSASPTVTCSEEIVKASMEFEPPIKKLKTNEITLKNLLDKDVDGVGKSQKKITSKETLTLPETPRLLSLLKASNEAQDPVTEYKQLLEEIDIPNPLMVPKDYFPNLLKHPRTAILSILSNNSSKNIPLDDILVVYKDKLLAAIETSQNNSTSNCKSNNCSKFPNKAPIQKSIEKNNNVSEKSAPITSKRKNTDATNKNSLISPDSKNSLANDIDAANEAALFWAGCPNPFEAMASYSNHNDFIQALYTASTLPYFPGQMGELHPGLQMMLGNKMVPPLGFPPPPPVNFNNPFELSMWQEAMMQASILKNKNPYENSILNQPNYRTNIENKKAQASSSHSSKPNMKHHGNRQSKNIPHSQEMQQQSFLSNSYGQAALGNESGWSNSYIGLGGLQQGSNNLTLNMPQFNPFSHRNKLSPTNKHNQQQSPNYQHKQNKETNLGTQYNDQEKKLQKQMLQEQQKMQQTQHQKVLKQQQQYLIHQQQQMLRESNGHRHHISSSLGKKANPISNQSSSKDSLREKSLNLDLHRTGNLQGPIDLSGVQNLKARHLAVTANGNSNFTVTSSKSMADDVPEVGSTTGSIEDMQEAHAQLWHPLFGSHNKGYSPWNLSSLTALGE